MIMRSIIGTSGRAATSSGKIGPLGPCGLLAVKITGNPNARADSASRSVWFFNSSALRSEMPKFIVPTWWSISSSAALLGFSASETGSVMGVLLLLGLPVHVFAPYGLAGARASGPS
jgi:hypothetical protein